MRIKTKFDRQQRGCGKGRMTRKQRQLLDDKLHDAEGCLQMADQTNDLGVLLTGCREALCLIEKARAILEQFSENT